MKYIKKILLLALILIAVGISNVYAAKGSVTTDGVRVRKGPSTDSEIVTILNKSAQVEILEETNGWYKIKYELYGTYEGYMSKDFVKKHGEETVPTTATPEPTQAPTAAPTATPTEQPTEEPEIIETPTISPTQAPQVELPQESLLGKKTTSTDVKLYVLPTVTSSVKNTIAKNTTINVLEVAGNYVYINYNNEKGWIKSNTLKPDESSNKDTNTKIEEPVTNTYTEKKGYVNVEQAIVRKKATTSSEMVTSLKINAEVTIIGEEGDFYKIKINNTEAYMAKRLISDTKTTTNRGGTSRQETTVATPTPVPTPVVEEKEEIVETPKPVVETPKVEKTPKPQTTVATSSIGEQMAQMAKSYVGYKYVYGGASPEAGFDCSGLVYYICGQLGYKVNRTADYQVNNGVAVEKSNLQPGDLVFFTSYNSTSRAIGHVGIYIGNNQFVHASTPSTGVIISSLNNAGYVQRYVTARRIGV